ncbi:MAG: RNA polymerase factor sigma-54 [Bacteroidales bacterium]|nr:RNA polymerase factor sigma-54 [Bacteroidales bacterium]
MLKQQQTLQQIQKLSPQQIQLIRMLELPIVELEQRVTKELEENPTLEEGMNENKDNSESETYNEDENGDNYESSEEISLGDYRSEDDIPDYKLQASNRAKDEREPEFTYTDTVSFFESLKEQLDLKEISQELHSYAEYIIGNLDNNGYLNRSLESIKEDIYIATGIDVPLSIMDDALSIVHELDPAGVGAKDLRECLILQIERKKGSLSNTTAYDILDKEFEAFTKKHFDRIKKSLNIDDEQLRNAMKEILALNPKPGNSLSDNIEEKSSQIIPDFIVENIDGELYVSLNNGNIPDLRINSQYSNMFEDWSNKANRNSQTKSALLFVKQKIDSARWFIEAIKQRNNTLSKTMDVIIQLQREFFLSGEESKLRPMILKDVAERAGFDISTISRVSNSKYVQTDFGIFPLKYLFSEKSQTENGEEVSTREIKKILATFVEKEDKGKPLSDDRLSELLKEKGYTVARRTVAKYREQLNIPVARLRKTI